MKKFLKDGLAKIRSKQILNKTLVWLFHKLNLGPCIFLASLHLGSVVDKQKDMSLFFRRDESHSYSLLSWFPVSSKDKIKTWLFVDQQPTHIYMKSTFENVS